MPATAQVVNETRHFKQLKVLELKRTASCTLDWVAFLVLQIIRRSDNVPDLLSSTHESYLDPSGRVSVRKLG